MLYSYIDALVSYGKGTGLITPDDEVYACNRLLALMGEDDYRQGDAPNLPLCDILKALTDIAVARGLCADSAERRDIFDSKLMDCLTPRPSEVRRKFTEDYFTASPERATDRFYRLSRASNYIRTDRIARDRRWVYDCKYGALDITINLSKPEKDPRDIAAAGKAKSVSYPLCQLCLENEGYAGRIGHPARSNHRVIPISLSGDDYFFQYSPYVYYNEHCIVFNALHTPMKIDRAAFEHLLDFERQFPHYFIGSNADLPIVGGSILSHDHFQGGRYEFAMERAPIDESFSVRGFEDVKTGVVRWPLSVLRLQGEDPGRLVELAVHILESWRSYTDEAAMIFAETDGTPHNTITPIARRRAELFELDLCLRNNLTTDEHPMGLYHPHEQRHHIKKENIGLIEVMGLAVLPARLDRELGRMEELLTDGKPLEDDPELEKHAQWASAFADELRGADRETVRKRLEQEVGRVFLGVLEDAGVYKNTPEGRAALRRFTEKL